MNTIFVGMDVSKDDFMAAVKDEQNNLIGPVKNYRHDRPGLEAFDKDIRAIKEQLRAVAVFGLESTGIYHLSLYQHLVEAGEHVKLFNALELKRFKSSIRKTKTDKLDAQAIAEALLLVREPSYHHVSEPELIQIRELCRLRGRLVKKASQCKNQAVRDMDVLCRGYTNLFGDVFSPSSIAIMKAAVRTTRLFQIDRENMTNILSEYMPRHTAETKAGKLQTLFQNAVVPEHMKDICVMELHMIIQQYELLKMQVKRIERRIETQVKNTNTHLLTIPGIGILTAGAILGELGNLSRFNSIDQL
ncbi:MAG: IS110 family transposase, partial [Thermoplasmata archaeon]|nr:IS110 family transposase [Thermoplasmata archaeon]